MLKSQICQSEINILYLRDIGNIIENETIHLLILEELDGTYSIYHLPLNYNINISDSYHRLAYEYDHLTPENQIRYQNLYRNLKKNKNGTYYEDRKKYTKNQNKLF